MSSPPKSMSPSKASTSTLTTTIASSRIRAIMQSGPEEVSIAPDALYVFTRATEMFVESLARLAHDGGDEMTYDKLAERVQNDEKLEFLHEIIPLKVRYGDVLEMNKKS